MNKQNKKTITSVGFQAIEEMEISGDTERVITSFLDLKSKMDTTPESEAEAMI